MRIAVGKKIVEIDLLPILFVWLISIWALFYWQSVLDLPEGEDSAFFIGPLAQISVLFSILITADCIRFKQIVGIDQSNDQNVQKCISKSLKNRLLFIISIIVYAISLEYIGAIITSIVYAVGLSIALKTKSLWTLFGIAIFISLFIIIIFVEMLRVPLPLWGTLFS